MRSLGLTEAKGAIVIYGDLLSEGKTSRAPKMKFLNQHGCEAIIKKSPKTAASPRVTLSQILKGHP